MAGLLAGLALGACDPEAFRCVTDADCEGAGPGAYCHASQLCAVKAGDCPSGAAFADYSGLLGRTCVPLDPDADDEPDTAPSPPPEPHDPSAHREPAPEPPRDDGDFGTFACQNGELDAYETDVDCGGPCAPCATCQACRLDTDCGGSDVCREGECRQMQVMVVDWLDNCAATPGGLDYATVDLPPGDYTVRALPSAGAKWSWEEAWGWFMDHCEGMDLSAMGQAFPVWFDTAQEAFDAIAVPVVERSHPGGVVACGLLDSICGDNRGGTIIAFERRCP